MLRLRRRDLGRTFSGCIPPTSHMLVFRLSADCGWLCEWKHVWGDVLTFDTLSPISGRPHSRSQSLENIDVGLSFCFKFSRTERRYPHPRCIISNIWISPASCSEDVLAIQTGNYFNQFKCLLISTNEVFDDSWIPTFTSLN